MTTERDTQNQDKAMAGKRVTLVKAHKAVLAFASKDETRPTLGAVHITPDYIEATDSYRLVRITHPADVIDPLDFPKGPDGDELVDEIPAEGVLVDAKALRKAFQGMPNRSTLPILNRVAIKPGDHYVALATTDLEQTTVSSSRKVEGSFPNIAELIKRYSEKEPIAEITLNPVMLKEIMAAFGHFGCGNAHHPVTFTITSELEPCVMTAENSDGMTMTAVLMPVRKG